VVGSRELDPPYGWRTVRPGDIGGPFCAVFGYIGAMPNDAADIVHCPAEFRAEALALVLCDLAPSLRRIVAHGLLDAEDSAELANEALFVALRGTSLRGAAWGQRQSGNIAVFWPPQLEAGEDELTAIHLGEAVVAVLDETSVEMAQAILPAPSPQTVAVLRHVGFRHVADLHYLSCESDKFPLAAPETFELEFVEYQPRERERLVQLIERTYEGTLDCTALNGMRDIEHVVNGYQGTGVYRPENWLLVRNAGEDVGVLLLADHPKGKHWELMYTGLVPEARGRGWGRQVTRYAQWLARGARVDRIVVAVDASNAPAMVMYYHAGFELWDKRAVYLRFPESA
jgi:ribosomal protein S18 acetylase RimI-like enzyme